MKKFILLLVCLSVLALTQGKSAASIDFEDLWTGVETAAPIPDGYKGFTWSTDAYSITKNAEPGIPGYGIGTFGNVSLFDAYANPITISKDKAFDFTGSYITAAAYTEDVTISGYLGSDPNPKYSTVVLAYWDKATWYNFNFVGIDRLTFVPFNWYGNTAQVVFDNMLLGSSPPPPPPPPSAVPLPSALFLFGPALAGLIGIKRRYFG